MVVTKRSVVMLVVCSCVCVDGGVVVFCFRLDLAVFSQCIRFIFKLEYMLFAKVIIKKEVGY